MGIEALGYAAVAASLVGAGVSYYSSVSAAKSQDAFALLNAQAQTIAARNAGSLQAAQAQLQGIQAAKEQEAAFANAAAIRGQTEAESRAAQENLRRSREDFQKQLASHRAAVASRGIVDTTGSPLELLVKQSETQALSELEMRHADEIARRQGFRSADLETVRGKVSGIDIGMSLLNAAAARNNAAMGAMQARLDLLSTRASSSAMRTQAAGALLSSVGSTGRDYYSYRKSQAGQTVI